MFVQADISGRMAVATPYLPWLKMYPGLICFLHSKVALGKNRTILLKNASENTVFR